MVGLDSSVGIATCYGLDGPVMESRWGASLSAPVQTCPVAHPASWTMGTGSFPGVKRPGRGVDHPPPSSVEVKERVELYLYSTFGPSWPVRGWPLPLPTPWSRDLRASEYSAVQEIPRILWISQGSLPRSKQPPDDRIPNQINRIHTLPSCLCNTHFNIIIVSLHRSSKLSVFLSCFFANP